MHRVMCADWQKCFLMSFIRVVLDFPRIICVRYVHSVDVCAIMAALHVVYRRLSSLALKCTYPGGAMGESPMLTNVNEKATLKNNL